VETSPAVSDLDKPMVTARTVLGYAVPIIVLGLAVGWLTWSRAQPDLGAPAVAQARVGLTDQVVWPFYDATRDRLSSAVDRSLPELAAATSDPDALKSVTAEAPINQSFLDIVATAADETVAIEAVEAAIQLLIEEDRVHQTASFQQALLFTEESLAELADGLSELDARIIELAQNQATLESRRATLSATDRPPIDGQLAQLQLERSRAEIERDRQLRQQAATRSELERIEGQLATIRPSVELLRPPAIGAGDSSTALLQTGLAVLVALAFGTVVALVWDRQLGRLRHVRQLPAAGAGPLLGTLAPSDPEGDTVCALSLYDAARRHDVRVVGLVTAGGAPLAPTIRRLAAALDRVGFAVATAGAEPTRRRSRRSGVEGVSTDVDIDAAELQRLPALHKALAAVAKESDLVLVACGALDRSERSERLQRSCDALVAVIPSGQHRVLSVRRSLRRRFPATYLGGVLLPGTDRREDRSGPSAGASPPGTGLVDDDRGKRAERPPGKPSAAAPSTSVRRSGSSARAGGTGTP
jgi:hypothetical protein